MKLKVESMPVSVFVSDPENARLHDDRNIDAIKRSLEKFGQQKPIVVDKDNVVVAGNGTLTAAAELGWSEIACVRTELGREEARAYAIADNRTAELADWNMEKLQATLDDLSPDLLDFTGFDLFDRVELSSESSEAAESEGQSGESPDRQAVIQYSIVFDSEVQQRVWFDFLKQLKATYPGGVTIAERLVRYIEESC